MFAVSVASLMLSIYVFAPQSENKVIRAIVVSIVMRVSFILVLGFGGALIHPAVGIAAACLAPLVVLKLWYGISLWRAWVVILFVGIAQFFLDGVALKLEDRLMPQAAPPATDQV